MIPCRPHEGACCSVSMRAQPAAASQVIRPGSRRWLARHPRCPWKLIRECMGIGGLLSPQMAVPLSWQGAESSAGRSAGLRDAHVDAPPLDLRERPAADSGISPRVAGAAEYLAARGACPINESSRSRSGPSWNHMAAFLIQSNGNAKRPLIGGCSPL